MKLPPRVLLTDAESAISRFSYRRAKALTCLREARLEVGYSPALVEHNLQWARDWGELARTSFADCIRAKAAQAAQGQPQQE